MPSFSLRNVLFLCIAAAGIALCVCNQEYCDVNLSLTDHSVDVERKIAVVACIGRGDFVSSTPLPRLGEYLG